MAFLHLTFSHFYFRDLGHSDLFSFRILGPTRLGESLAESHA